MPSAACWPFAEFAKPSYVKNDDLIGNQSRSVLRLSLRRRVAGQLTESVHKLDSSSSLDGIHREAMSGHLRLNLVVIKTCRPVQLLAFYAALGLQFQEEQHGTGPIHWSSNLEGVLFEVYPVEDKDVVESSTRIGFDVSSLTAIFQTLRATNVEIISEPKPSRWGLRAVVRDPDGRSVELTQSTK